MVGVCGHGGHSYHCFDHDLRAAERFYFEQAAVYGQVAYLWDLMGLSQLVKQSKREKK